MTDPITLPLDLGVPERRQCWYGGDCAGPYEREHQLPIIRGGGQADPTVIACRFHNTLKGWRTVEEFRSDLAAVLGLEPADVVFGGEVVTAGRPATDLRTVRSLAEDRGGVRLYPEADRALRRLQLIERGRGAPRTSLTALASQLILEGAERRVAQLRSEQLPGLEDDEVELDWRDVPAPLSPAKVPVRRRVTRIAGELHEALVAAVLFRRTKDRPELLLVDAVDEAAADYVVRVEDDLNGGRTLPAASSYDEAEIRAVSTSWGRLSADSQPAGDNDPEELIPARPVGE